MVVCLVSFLLGAWGETVIHDFIRPLYDSVKEIKSDYVCFRLFVDLVFADFSNKEVVVDDFIKSNFYDLELYHGLLYGKIQTFDSLPNFQEWQMEKILYNLWDTLTEVGGIKITTDIRDYTEPLDIGWKKMIYLKS